MVIPMPRPSQGKSEPLTGRKIAQRVISGASEVFETGTKTGQAKITDLRTVNPSPLSILVKLCYISLAEESFYGVVGRFLAKIPSFASLPHDCLHVFRPRLGIAPSAVPASPFVAPCFPETPLSRLAFQSFPSLSLLPNISSAHSFALIDMDT